MFRILGRTGGKLVDVAVDGPLTPTDFAELRDKIAPLVDEYGKVRLIFDLSGLEEFEGEGLWDEQSFETKEPVERVALVVPQPHAQRARAVFSLDASEVETFTPDEAEKAWRWLVAS